MALSEALECPDVRLQDLRLAGNPTLLPEVPLRRNSSATGEGFQTLRDALQGFETGFESDT